jgi:hypothetical protein
VDEGNKFYQGHFPHHSAPGVNNPFENSEFYPDPSINFYDADLINIARYEGLIGIQLDEHRIAGRMGLQVSKSMEHGHAWLAWNQVLHMVELWDRLDFPDAWDRICLGSDFDGIICPMKGIHRLSDYPELYKGLLMYSELYFMPQDEFIRLHPRMAERGNIANRWQKSGRNRSGMRLNPAGLNAPEQTGLTPKEIVDKISYSNTLEFMKKWFN